MARRPRGPEVPVRRFHTKLAGVALANDDGIRRRDIIRRCREGERVFLERDVGHPYDREAMKVCRESGQQIGVLSAPLAGQVAAEMEQGWVYAARIKSITGGGRGGRYGVDILVVKSDPEATTDADVEAAMALPVAPSRWLLLIPVAAAAAIAALMYLVYAR